MFLPQLFADYCLLYRVISRQDDAESLRYYLYRLQEWERDWQMAFNPDKCEHIRITNKKKIVQTTWGDRKVRIKMLSFLYLLLFRDEISSNNAAIYMQLIHCNNACIKRTRALQLSLWKHHLSLRGATKRRNFILISKYFIVQSSVTPVLIAYANILFNTH